MEDEVATAHVDTVPGEVAYPFKADHTGNRCRTRRRYDYRIGAAGIFLLEVYRSVRAARGGKLGKNLHERWGSNKGSNPSRRHSILVQGVDRTGKVWVIAAIASDRIHRGSRSRSQQVE